MKQGLQILMTICLMAPLMLLTLTACGTNPAVSDPTPTTTATTTTTTTVEQEEPLNTLTLTGRVLEVSAEDEAALMECIGDCPLGDRVWVQYGGVSDVTPQVGETYAVTYEDLVMPSLPPRIVAVKMVLTESK